jgi:hypothetical protein
MLMTLVILASIVMLAPAFLYAINVIRDPFHPLIFVGIISYFIAPHRLLFNSEATFMVLEERYFVSYTIASMISVLGVYVGWFWAGKRNKNDLNPEPLHGQYDVSRMIIFAILFAIIGAVSHYQYKDIGYTTEISGYARDLRGLWIAGAILTIQAIILLPRSTRFPLYLLLGLCIYPAVERFLAYGQRGDTFRLAVLGMLAYLMLKKRPSKVAFISLACGLGMLLATLHFTRAVVANGDAPNRLSAIAKVIPEFVKATSVAPTPAMSRFSDRPS